MAAETYDSDDGLITRSPPLSPVRASLLDWEESLPQSRSPSPWEMRPQRKRHFADFNSRTPSPTPSPKQRSRRSRNRKRNRKSGPCHADAILVDLMGDSAHPDIAARAGEGTLPQSDDSDLEDVNSFRSIRRMDLPMVIQGLTIISRPDSGSEENIIAADVLSTLDLKMDNAPEHRKEFRVANGKSVWALGRIMVKCSFAKDRTLDFHCTFYVFKNLTSALIMGMPFLDETQTLIKYQYRLQPRIVRPFGPVQLNSLNNPRKRLYRLVNSQPRFANADTGSEIDLMSLEYVLKRGFPMTAVGLHSHTVQFADGSTSELVGKVSVLIVLGTPEGPRVVTTFYVLDGLTCDILFGEDFLDMTAAFENYRDAFSIIECDDGTAEVNGIVWFSKAESHLSRAIDALPLRSRSGKGPILEESSEQSEERLMHGIKNRIDRLFRSKIETDHSELVATVSKSSANLNDLDARELHRREVTQQYISDLPVEERESEIAKEDERLRSYERSRADLTARDPKLFKKFLCDYPGCLAKPFDSQNLLNTHAIIHSRFFNQPYAHDQPPRDLQNNKSTLPSAESRLSPSSFSTAPSPRPHPLDMNRSHSILPPLSGVAGESLRIGAFKCAHAGCMAPAFQTQYLLNSHANVHFQDRCHYCPVPGCARSEGGRGFKRKNEMIRHGLMHESPGYICPFCPGSEHKYPRPDNLQRHVRVNHMDVDISHPQLREVLAQRTEGGSTGRR